MAQTPINAAGGKAAVVQALLPDDDVARLVRLAELRGLSRSAVARELLSSALDQLELADTGPPQGG